MKKGKRFQRHKKLTKTKKACRNLNNFSKQNRRISKYVLRYIYFNTTFEKQIEITGQSFIIIRLFNLIYLRLHSVSNRIKTP